MSLSYKRADIIPPNKNIIPCVIDGNGVLYSIDSFSGNNVNVTDLFLKKKLIISLSAVQDACREASETV